VCELAAFSETLAINGGGPQSRILEKSATVPYCSKLLCAVSQRGSPGANPMPILRALDF
jgi:hypothetical protein